MADTSQHVQLDGREVVRTSAHMVQRIMERFPDSGLGAVCRTIHDTCADTQAQIDALQNLFFSIGTAEYLFKSID